MKFECRCGLILTEYRGFNLHSDDWSYDCTCGEPSLNVVDASMQHIDISVSRVLGPSPTFTFSFDPGILGPA